MLRHAPRTILREVVEIGGENAAGAEEAADERAPPLGSELARFAADAVRVVMDSASCGHLNNPAADRPGHRRATSSARRGSTSRVGSRLHGAWSRHAPALVSLTRRGSCQIRYFATMSGGGKTWWSRSSRRSTLGRRSAARGANDGERTAIDDVGADYRDPHIFVPEQRLNRPDVGARLQQVGRGAVAEGMARRALGEPRRASGTVHDPLQCRFVQVVEDSSRKAWWSRSETPSCCQSRSLRQHVMPLPPSSCGRYSQGISVLRTNKVPVGAISSGVLGRSPCGFGRRSCKIPKATPSSCTSSERAHEAGAGRASGTAHSGSRLDRLRGSRASPLGSREEVNDA